MAWPFHSGKPYLSAAFTVLMEMDWCFLLPSFFLIRYWEQIIWALQLYLSIPHPLHSSDSPLFLAISSFSESSLPLAYLSFQADRAEKSGDKYFNLAYLSLHTFSLLFFVPSNSSKLLSKVSLLCRCPLFLKSDHNHICDLTYVDSKHQLALFLSLVAHTPVLPCCPKGHHPIFSVQGRKRLSAKCLRVE